jgi:hypothetical protein
MEVFKSSLVRPEATLSISKGRARDAEVDTSSLPMTSAVGTDLEHKLRCSKRAGPVMPRWTHPPCQ